MTDSTTPKEAGLPVVAFLKYPPKKPELARADRHRALTDEERGRGWVSDPTVRLSDAQAIIDRLEHALKVSEGVGHNLFDSAQQLLQENLALKAAQPDPEKVIRLVERWFEVWHLGDTAEGEAADTAAREALRAYVTAKEVK